MRLTYQNPVWKGDFADPFVLKSNGVYYAYGTSIYARAPERGGFAFPVLQSNNLVSWSYAGGAIAAQDGYNYWAPSVAEKDGRFYLYYSFGATANDATHRLHVAVADHPVGPFEVIGGLLPDAGFSIDAEPFCDPADGKWYLFFAADFFDARVGTGIAAVPLADTMDKPLGEVVTILRATADWQIYERNRLIYGQRWPAWHTLEGPSMIHHNGRYYCLYSGGAWHSPDYGVSFGVAENVLGPYLDGWSATGPAVLRAIPGVPGPGHNSLVIGPDDRTTFVVYHAWDNARTARRMCIDPLMWTPDGPRCNGPSTSLQVIEG